MDRYAEVADWDLSTRKANEVYIRRVIKPALGHLQVRKIRGPLLDLLYAQLRRCGDPGCTGKRFIEHRNVPVLAVDLASRQPAWQQVADAIGDAIRSGMLAAGEPLPSVREMSALQGVPVATLQHALAVLADEGLVVVRQGRTAVVAGDVTSERRSGPGCARPRSRLQARRMPAACVQADDGEDDPERSQHLVRRLLHGRSAGSGSPGTRRSLLSLRLSRDGRSPPRRPRTWPR